MLQRNESLDALRGFAILTMVLSGAIAYGGVLPPWMYHAQVPPPLHKFDAAIPGITWVDLVFPFFLFSMGAAIPLALKKHIEAGKGAGYVLQLAAKRFALLAFFALFTQHMKAWVIVPQPGVSEQLLSLFAFVLLFFQFYDYKGQRYRRIFIVIRILAFAAAVYLLWLLPFWNGKGFDLYKSDIIILVLANMAFFCTIIYYFTRNQPLLRIGLLPFVMAIFLAAKEPGGGWAKMIFEWKGIGSFQIDWLYKFYFLKYLFLILPGTIAGEWMLQVMQQKEENSALSRNHENLLSLLATGLLVLNLYGLFTRELVLNVTGSLLICIGALYLLRSAEPENLYRKLAEAGTYLLLLGLFFEAYEGGIKKDSSTYSYYFVTGGLAFFMLIIFTVLAKRNYFGAISTYFALNGKNPMVAYVAGNLLLLPLLQLTHTKFILDSMTQNAWMGFLRGVLFTGIVSLITIFFVKRKWFWKT
ncbi:MAG TPA: DUF5009 domain-containing protein [Lacibacter sp.]|nr:DUF5009 domain-containing protein [Lacibacter sp.]HMO89156.1 DUF5009 domain-containing protein [Lacibacter sp.]HMP86669.1 DUF5009 domain-containing protein [Lacibacter sp.]